MEGLGSKEFKKSVASRVNLFREGSGLSDICKHWGARYLKSWETAVLTYSMMDCGSDYLFVGLSDWLLGGWL